MYVGSFQSPRKCSRSIKASNEKKVFDDFLIIIWLEKTFLSKLTWNIVPLREKKHEYYCVRTTNDIIIADTPVYWSLFIHWQKKSSKFHASP